jgi:TolA-binding protein
MVYLVRTLKGYEMGRPYVKSIALYLILLSVGSGAGCVYYNTFHHAIKYYEDGMKEVERSDGKVSNKARDDFQKSIQKCVKVLTDYPTSSYIDDALLLMGKALYQKTEFLEAITTFEKLLLEYPESDQRTEALYWKAKAEFYEGIYSECLVTMDQLDGMKKRDEWVDELSFLRGETHFQANNFTSSYEEFRKLLEGKSSSRWQDEGLLRMAQCQFYLENYDEALENFQALVVSTPTLSLKREGYFWIASSFSEIGRYQEAADAYQELLSGELTDEEIVTARIGLGRQYIQLDKIDDAFKIFELITLDYPKTPEAAEAFYLQGTIHLESLQDSDKAREEFQKGYRQAPNSEYGKLCEDKWKEVERLRKLNEFIDDEDNGSNEGLPQAYYLISEFHFHQLKDLEETLTGFQTVIDSFPESPWAPKAAYAKAWIMEEELGDTIASNFEYRQLVDGYPDTRYADYARLKLNMDIPERPAGFYQDEMEGQILSAVAIDVADLLREEPSPDEIIVTDSLPDATPDSIPPGDSAPEDSIPGG